MTLDNFRQSLTATPARRPDSRTPRSIVVGCQERGSKRTIPRNRMRTQRGPGFTPTSIAGIGQLLCDCEGQYSLLGRAIQRPKAIALR